MTRVAPNLLHAIKFVSDQSLFSGFRFHGRDQAVEIQLVLSEHTEKRPLNMLQVYTNTFKLLKALYNTDIQQHLFNSIMTSEEQTRL